MTTTRRISVAVVLLCWCGLAGAQEGVDRADLKTWNAGPGKELGKKVLQRQLKELSQLLSSAKRAPINKNVTEPQLGQLNNRVAMVFPSTESKLKMIKQIEKAIEAGKEAEKDPPPAYPELYFTNLSVGRIGVLTSPSSSKDMSFQVRQIVDGNNMIVDIPTARHVWSETVWFIRPTKGLIDDRTYEFSGRIIEVVRTKQYTTVTGGSKTLLQITERDLSELNPP